MRDSVWVMYKDNGSIGVVATKVDAIRYLVDTEWIKINQKDIGYWDNEGYIYLTPREAAKQANTTVEKILGEALEDNLSPYFMRWQLRIQEQQIICGYDTPVD